jgi:hypothetical protein
VERTNRERERERERGRERERERAREKSYVKLVETANLSTFLVVFS